MWLSVGSHISLSLSLSLSLTQDISVWVKKVQFKLHDSYPNPQRSKLLAVILTLSCLSLFECVGFAYI